MSDTEHIGFILANGEKTALCHLYFLIKKLKVKITFCVIVLSVYVIQLVIVFIKK